MAYDVVVAGLGAMGSATVYQLTRLGATVLGIDRFSPPHAFGSTHGDTRITRLAVGEGPEYVPLVRRSHEIWRDIERATGARLLHQCGGLVMAVPDGRGRRGASGFLSRTVETARQFGIAHELVGADEIGRRFPQLELTGAEQGYYESEAGFVRPERCVEAQLRSARRGGAVLRLGERVTSYRDDGTGVTVTTSGGIYAASKLVISAGPWVGELLPDLASRFAVYRQVLHWFDLDDPSRYESYAEMPVYIWEFGRGADDFMYGFPMVDGPEGGAKVATETYAAPTTPDGVARDVTRDETDSMYDGYVAPRLRGLSRRSVKARSCLYTVTAGGRFVLDVHPSDRNVIVASPCSGHGFKHSAAIGEVVAQLATRGSADIDVTAFRLGTD
ncbi:MAG: N-methyl-L-tryptophan oxidase [Nocardioidaceae bacterium]